MGVTNMKAMQNRQERRQLWDSQECSSSDDDEDSQKAHVHRLIFELLQDGLPSTGLPPSPSELRQMAVSSRLNRLLLEAAELMDDELEDQMEKDLAEDLLVEGLRPSTQQLDPNSYNSYDSPVPGQQADPVDMLASTWQRMRAKQNDAEATSDLRAHLAEQEAMIRAELQLARDELNELKEDRAQLAVLEQLTEWPNESLADSSDVPAVKQPAVWSPAVVKQDLTAPVAQRKQLSGKGPARVFGTEMKNTMSETLSPISRLLAEAEELGV